VAPSRSSSHPRERERPVYWLGRRLFRLLGLTYFRWQVWHEERLPRTGRVLIAANHQSFLDPAIIGAALPRPLHYLARKNVFDHPLAGAVLRSVNTLPVDRDGSPAGGLRAGFEVLAREQALLLFPEGTRTRTGELQAFRSGVGMIAARSQAPVLPVRIFGLWEAYGRDHKLPRPGHVVVSVGPLLRFDSHWAELRQANKGRQRQIFEEITASIRQAIAALRRDPTSSST
jgi:1-acyl-sn-glycerol-3-phosphate acyltransferase